MIYFAIGALVFLPSALLLILARTAPLDPSPELSQLDRWDRGER